MARVHLTLNQNTPTQSHHIIQHAAVRDLPGYNYYDAPAIPLQGPSTSTGTPHNAATMVQQNGAYGGGNYAAERRIGYRALRAAGISRSDARFAIETADQYFFSLGVNYDTQTRIPGNRR